MRTSNDEYERFIDAQVTQAIDAGDLAKMRPSAFVVYSAVIVSGDFETHESSVDVDVIARQTGLSRRAIVKSLGKLEQMGYIERSSKIVVRLLEKWPVLAKE